MKDEERYCVNCRYFWRHRGDSEEGSCRRRAPKPGLGAVAFCARWPLVDGGDWCGEWDDRGEAATDFKKLVRKTVEDSKDILRALEGKSDEEEKI